MFKTDNYFLAAALSLSGQPIERLEPQSADSNYYVVVFDDSTELRSVVESFYNGKMELSAGKLFMEYKQLVERSKSMR